MNQTKIDDRMMTIELWIVVSTTILFLFCQHPPRKGVLKYMAEAIISRRGWPAEGKPVPPELKVETITGSTEWTVPNNIKGNISVLIFGGGGGGGNWSGGGGGWMNNGEFNIPGGTKIQITIGNGGTTNTYSGKAGGTTAFGNYLSAAGGEGAQSQQGGNGGSGGGSYNSKGGRGYQFGGGGGYADYHGTGGDGGTWGGGGGTKGHYYDSTGTANAGNGGTYGGGGGADAGGRTANA